MRAALFCLLLIATTGLGLPDTALAAPANQQHCADMLSASPHCDVAEHGCAQCPAATAIPAQTTRPPFAPRHWRSIAFDERIPRHGAAPPLPPPISQGV